MYLLLILLLESKQGGTCVGGGGTISQISAIDASTTKGDMLLPLKEEEAEEAAVKDATLAGMYKDESDGEVTAGTDAAVARPELELAPGATRGVVDKATESAPLGVAAAEEAEAEATPCKKDTNTATSSATSTACTTISSSSSLCSPWSFSASAPLSFVSWRLLQPLKSLTVLGGHAANKEDDETRFDDDRLSPHGDTKIRR